MLCLSSLKSMIEFQQWFLLSAPFPKQNTTQHNLCYIYSKFIAKPKQIWTAQNVFTFLWCTVLNYDYKSFRYGKRSGETIVCITYFKLENLLNTQFLFRKRWRWSKLNSQWQCFVNPVLKKLKLMEVKMHQKEVDNKQKPNSWHLHIFFFQLKLMHCIKACGQMITNIWRFFSLSINYFIFLSKFGEKKNQDFSSCLVFHIMYCTNGWDCKWNFCVASTIAWKNHLKMFKNKKICAFEFS